MRLHLRRDRVAAGLRFRFPNKSPGASATRSSEQDGPRGQTFRGEEFSEGSTIFLGDLSQKRYFLDVTRHDLRQPANKGTVTQCSQMTFSKIRTNAVRKIDTD